jgi:hypothetical protein
MNTPFIEVQGKETLMCNGKENHHYNEELKNKSPHIMIQRAVSAKQFLDHSLLLSGNFMRMVCATNKTSEHARIAVPTRWGICPFYCSCPGVHE